MKNDIITIYCDLHNRIFVCNSTNNNFNSTMRSMTHQLFNLRTYAFGRNFNVNNID